MPEAKKKTSRGKKAYEKGAELEKRVASWLKRQFGYKCKKRDFARGKIAKRPYEVDIHATRKVGLGRRGTTIIIGENFHVWVESKAYRIKRRNVTKLVESARDVRDAHEDGIEEWHPDMLMLVSDKGFDVDAIGMADKYGIYCVEAKRTYEFAGKMNREDFENKESSEY